MSKKIKSNSKCSIAYFLFPTQQFLLVGGAKIFLSPGAMYPSCATVGNLVKTA